MHKRYEIIWDFEWDELVVYSRRIHNGVLKRGEVILKKIIPKDSEISYELLSEIAKELYLKVTPEELSNIAFDIKSSMKPYKVSYNTETNEVEVYSRRKKRMLMQIPTDFAQEEKLMLQLKQLLDMNGDVEEFPVLQYAICQVATNKE